MLHTIDHLVIIRKNILKAIDGMTLDELSTVPKGFNNHLLWNVCHVLVTQQLLVYKLSNQPMLVSDDFVARYRKGTAPSGDAAVSEDFNYLQEKFLSSVDKLHSDIENNLFTEYQEYATSFGVTLRSTDDAIAFNNLHESMHLGYMLSLKHAL